MMKRRKPASDHGRVTVVGGGLAGLVAAIESGSQGHGVRLFEERAELGGRARTTPLPFLANFGPHALYADGAFWDWLRRNDLLPPTVGRGDASLVYQRRGEGFDGRELRESLGPILAATAPIDRSFRSWAAALVGEIAVEPVIGLSFLVTYDRDPGRLSARFVSDRLRRLVRADSVRYVVGGWGNLVNALSARAVDVGVEIVTRHKVSVLPEPPVILALPLSATRRLLRREDLHWEGTRVALLDVVLPGDDVLPTGVLDLERRVYLSRSTAFDETLAPTALQLIQISTACDLRESLKDAEPRMEALLDGLAPAWRHEAAWLRRLLLSNSTGAVDLPGTDCEDRPGLAVGDGVFLAGDALAAPGLLSEVSFASGRTAAALAHAFLEGRRLLEARLAPADGSASPPPTRRMTSERTDATERVVIR